MDQHTKTDRLEKSPRERFLAAGFTEEHCHQLEETLALDSIVPVSFPPGSTVADMVRGAMLIRDAVKKPVAFVFSESAYLVQDEKDPVQFLEGVMGLNVCSGGQTEYGVREGISRALRAASPEEAQALSRLSEAFPRDQVNPSYRISGALISLLMSAEHEISRKRDHGAAVIIRAAFDLIGESGAEQAVAFFARKQFALDFTNEEFPPVISKAIEDFVESTMAAAQRKLEQRDRRGAYTAFNTAARIIEMFPDQSVPASYIEIARRLLE
jgi:hypothetical protein